MGTDPYGFPSEEEPEPAHGWWFGSALAVSLTFFGIAALCLLGDLFILSFTPETGIDWLGVALLASMPVWPALGIAIATLLLYGTTRRAWTLFGPNVVLGGGAGCGLWAVLFFGVILVSVLMER